MDREYVERLREVIAENRRKGVLKRRLPRVPNAIRKQLIADYQSGIARGYLGPKYKLTQHQVSKVLKYLSRTPMRRPTSEQKALIKELYKPPHVTVRLLAQKLNLTTSTVHRIIIQQREQST